MKPLTPGERRFLLALVAFLERNGMPPSCRDLMRILRFKSTSGVMHYVRALREKGWLEDDGERFHESRQLFPVGMRRLIGDTAKYWRTKHKGSI